MESGFIDYVSLGISVKKLIRYAVKIFKYMEKNDYKCNFYKIYESVEHELTRQDKKAFALFLASAFMDGFIKQQYEDFDGFSLEDMCEYIDIDPEEIRKVTSDINEDYAKDLKDYDEIYKTYLSSLIREFSEFHDILSYSPELILAALATEGDKTGSKIVVDYFGQHCDTHMIICLDHPVYKALLMYCEDNNHVQSKYRKDTPKKPVPVMEPPRMEMSNLISDIITLTERMKEESSKEEELTDLKMDKDKVLAVIEELSKKYIGQEQLAEELFYNIFNNIMLSRKDNVEAGERSIIFIDGPSGTGKTAVSIDIAKRMQVPYTCVSATSFSATGYVGGDVEDPLKELYEKANNNMELAQRGIVIIDEFDKLAANDKKDIVMKDAVQSGLLHILGGGEVKITLGRGLFSSSTEFDTSKLTFILLGAISGLREDKTESKRIGFSTAEDEEKSKTYYITPDDLIKMGLKKELVGRINTYLHTDDYSKETLEKILRESKISPLKTMEAWAKDYGKTLVIDDEVYGLIAAHAYSLNTGARSLQTVVSAIRTRLIKEVLLGDSKEIHLDKTLVDSAFNKTVSRTMRG